MKEIREPSTEFNRRYSREDVYSPCFYYQDVSSVNLCERSPFRISGWDRANQIARQNESVGDGGSLEGAWSSEPTDNEDISKGFLNLT